MARKTNKTNHVLNLLSTGMEEGTDDGMATVESAEQNLSDSIKEQLEQDFQEPIIEEPVGEEISEVKDISTDEVMETVKKETKKIDFEYVSVMETLVAEIIPDYLKKYGKCTCQRCQVDAMALALTNLPSKYVVVDETKVSPIMNFYGRQYDGQVTVEVTKACIQVGEHPHHP